MLVKTLLWCCIAFLGDLKISASFRIDADSLPRPACFASFSPVLSFDTERLASKHTCFAKSISAGANRLSRLRGPVASPLGRHLRGSDTRAVGLVCMAAGGVRKDYYAILGVDRKADTATIKKAYKKLAMKNHPDVNKSPGAKDTFIALNEAYAVLSDEKQRRMYDLGGANPFSGWGGSSSSSSSTTSSSWGSGRSTSSGAPFDVDAFWNQYRPREETVKDVNDSFSAIFNDLFDGVKKTTAKSRRRGGSARRDSILDDFGDFLETIFDEGMSEDEVDDEQDAEALQVEIDDATFVVEQLKQRAAKLSTDAASAEGMAADWARKGSSEDIKDKADSFKRMAARLSERAGKFKGEKKTYIYHTEYIQHWKAR